MIKWRNSDLIRLGKAVSLFNKKIQRIKKLEKEGVRIPELLNYKEVKQNIYSRGELNRIINSLKRINKENSLKVKELKSGAKLIEWEFNEINIERRSLSRKINTQIKKVKSQTYKEQPYKTEEQKLLEARLRLIQNIPKLTQRNLNKAIVTLHMLSSRDYDYIKALNYKQNYMEVMARYKGMPGYTRLKHIMEKLSPQEFYNVAKRDYILKDLSYLSDNTLNYEQFSQIADMWGVSLNEYIGEELIKDTYETFNV